MPPFFRSNEFAVYGRCLLAQAGARIWLAVGLLVAIGLLEGSGLLVLVPLLRAVGLGPVEGGVGFMGSIDAVLRPASGGGKLGGMLAIFVGIKVVQVGLRAASNTLNLRIETDFVSFLRERFYRALIEAPWLHVTRQRASDLTQTLLTELPWVGGGTRQLLGLGSTALVGAAQVVVAWMLSPGMTAFALGSGAIVAWGLQRLRRRSQALGVAGHEKRGEMAAAVHEHLAGVKLAKSHEREAHHFEHFRATMRELAARTFDLQRINALTAIWLEVGAVVALGLFVYVSITFRHVPVAQLLVLAFVFTRLLAGATQFLHQWHQVTSSLPSFAAAEKIRRELMTDPEPALQRPLRRLALTQGIVVEDLTFHYDPASATAALRDLNLTIPARRVVALCGPSGAGKSTLADLLLGLLTPTRGRVRVDGAELAGELRHDWRHSIGYVPQETFLFHDTVRANLLWAQPGAGEAELRAALRAAAAEAFVDRLPQGLDTVLGDRGVRLSGGERQRLALARALLRQPTLLVLDEATSSLDTHNERLVQDAIERLHGELTIVLIAHRLSTVRMADQIIVLDGGRAVESGTWEELSARPDGAFRRLLAANAAHVS